jgi:hypothetical protein
MLLLIWSEAASASRWVKLEWTNAVSLDKAIIPCLLEATKLPAILTHKVYVDFRNIDHGITHLLQALNLAQQKTLPAPTNPTEQVARVTHSRLSESSAPTKPKPSQIALRSQPLYELSVEQVRTMLKEKGFFDSYDNKSDKGLRHEYELNERQGEKLVIDHASGLTWQQSGSSKPLSYDDAEKYVHDLNDRHFAGYNDWRLPTLEESMSLMEPQKHGELYIDSIFDRNQRWIWTVDKFSASWPWSVSFYWGAYSHGDVRWGSVRAVR